MHVELPAIVGAVVVLAASTAIVLSLRTAELRERAASHFVCAWATAAGWFGALPIIGSADLGLSTTARTSSLAHLMLLLGGSCATLWFIAVGIRLQHKCSRYPWRPWSVSAVVFVLGMALMLAGAIIASAAIGAGTADAGRIPDTLAGITLAGACAMAPIAAAAGVWGWQSQRRETIGQPTVREQARS